jgi:hypothetical protein
MSRISLRSRVIRFAGAVSTTALLFAGLYFLGVSEWRIYLTAAIVAMLPFYVTLKRTPRP